MSLDAIQKAAYNAVRNGENIFITGGAGTGKSYLTRTLVKYAIAENIDHGITSSTGVSAVLIDGTTIHSWSGIGLAEGTVTEIVDQMRHNAIRRIKSAKLLIIDEISMIGTNVFNKIYQVVQRVRGINKPFGGLQVIVVGDFLQLKPIDDDWVFNSELWQYMNFRVFTLQTQYRQTNQEFFHALGRIRVGNPTDEDKALIEARVRPAEDFCGIKPTRLHSTRANVDKYNREEFAKLKLIRTYSAEVTKGRAYASQVEAAWRRVQCVKELPCAVGAQIMLTKNLDVLNGFCNGSRGVVTDCTPEGIEVQFVRGKMTITPAQFTVRVTPDTSVIITQIPLILAYATTIHKSQGSTLDVVELDLSRVFTDGMGYVGLSRCTSLDHTYITSSPDWSNIYADPEALAYYGIEQDDT
jgi:ATP-dependent DNA helicase PIF1